MFSRDLSSSLLYIRIWTAMGIVAVFVIGGIVMIIGAIIEERGSDVRTIPLDHYEQGALIRANPVLQIPIIIAKTPIQQECGLSVSSRLPPNAGMFFDFSREGTSRQHPIWMKDMRYAIDIVWLDEHMRIIAINEKVEPNTYPETFDAEEPSMYVLELPPGFAWFYLLAIGDQFDFHLYPDTKDNHGRTLCE